MMGRKKKWEEEKIKRREVEKRRVHMMKRLKKIEENEGTSVWCDFANLLANVYFGIGLDRHVWPRGLCWGAMAWLGSLGFEQNVFKWMKWMRTSNTGLLTSVTPRKALEGLGVLRQVHKIHCNNANLAYGYFSSSKVNRRWFLFCFNMENNNDHMPWKNGVL